MSIGEQGDVQIGRNMRRWLVRQTQDYLNPPQFLGNSVPAPVPPVPYEFRRFELAADLAPGGQALAWPCSWSDSAGDYVTDDSDPSVQFLVQDISGYSGSGRVASSGYDPAVPGFQGWCIHAHDRGSNDAAIDTWEIVGLAGLVGAGRSELARAIFGIDRPDAGRVVVGGRRLPGGALDILAPVEVRVHYDSLRLAACQNIEVGDVVRMAQYRGCGHPNEERAECPTGPSPAPGKIQEPDRAACRCD